MKKQCLFSLFAMTIFASCYEISKKAEFYSHFYTIISCTKIIIEQQKKIDEQRITISAQEQEIALLEEEIRILKSGEKQVCI